MRPLRIDAYIISRGNYLTIVVREIRNPNNLIILKNIGFEEQKLLSCQLHSAN